MKIRWVNLDNFQQKKIFFVWELHQAMYMATEMTQKYCRGKKGSTLTAQPSTIHEQNLAGTAFMTHKVGL